MAKGQMRSNKEPKKPKKDKKAAPVVIAGTGSRPGTGTPAAPKK